VIMTRKILRIATAFQSDHEQDRGLPTFNNFFAAESPGFTGNCISVTSP